MENPFAAADPRDIALAYIRVELASIAPEIADNEIVPTANLRSDLGLDELSIWALATSLEKELHIEFADNRIAKFENVADITATLLPQLPATIAQLGHTLAPAPHTVDDKALKDAEPTTSHQQDNDDFSTALEDLASLFNS